VKKDADHEANICYQTLCSDEALAQLQIFQREDFEGIFEAMDGLPVTIRLLDPPLHEFLPKEGTTALHELVDKVNINVLHIFGYNILQAVLSLRPSGHC
jgi:phosphoenolpyruvate synthase/pyruvate phosphate dikinase